MSTAALILAAGESRRMGTPKALLEYQGETFLDRLIRLFARYSSPVIVVLGADRERIARGMRRAGSALVVENPDFRLGQITSMQCGLRALPAEADRVLFTLVDHPAVRPDTVEALLGTGANAPLYIPRFDGRRGHPIAFSKHLAQEFLALPSGSTAREVLQRHAAEICYLDVDDPGVVADIDDPKAYRRLLEGMPV